MSLIYKVKNVVNQSPIFQFIFNMSKWIVNVVPFYLVEEGYADENDPKLKPRIDMERLSFSQLYPDDTIPLSQHPEVTGVEEKLLNKLPNNWHCIGIRCDGIIIAYMLSNLRQCDSKYLKFKLKKNEAYLTYARTLYEYRGNNLAPFLRCKMYEHLKNNGHDIFYSITEYFNEPAIRFKKKLNVRKLKLYLWICLFKSIKFSMILKKY